MSWEPAAADDDQAAAFRAALAEALALARDPRHVVALSRVYAHAVGALDVADDSALEDAAAPAVAAAPAGDDDDGGGADDDLASTRRLVDAVSRLERTTDEFYGAPAKPRASRPKKRGRRKKQRPQAAATTPRPASPGSSTLGSETKKQEAIALLAQLKEILEVS